MKNILLTIAYDGSDFCGWQRQPGKRTVCGTLEKTVSDVLGEEIKLDGTSRTDAGVHAYGQRASFTAECNIPADRLARVINDALARDRLEGVSDIRVIKAEQMPEGFHARYSAKGKRYIYRIFNSPEKSVFRRRSFYQVSEALDIGAMEQCAELLKGEHDFRAFMSSGSTPQKTTVRRISRFDIVRSQIDDKSSVLELVVEGDSFLYNQVRIMAGSLVEAGLHKKNAEDILIALQTGDRTRAGHVAPAQGLYLDEIFY